MADNTASRHLDSWHGWEIWYYGSEASLPTDVTDTPAPDTRDTPGTAPHVWVVRDDAEAAAVSLATLPWPSDAARHQVTARAA